MPLSRAWPGISALHLCDISVPLCQFSADVGPQHRIALIREHTRDLSIWALGVGDLLLAWGVPAYSDPEEQLTQGVCRKSVTPWVHP